MFHSMPNFSEFFCLAGDFRIIIVCQHFFTLNIPYEEVDSGIKHEEKHFVRYHLYRLFLKVVTNDLKQ